MGYYLKFPFSKFGKVPSEKDLQRIRLSKNFKDGKFINQDNRSYNNLKMSYFEVLKTIWKMLSLRKPKIKSIKTNLLNLGSSDNFLIWFGHSSYLIQIEGKKFLIDPVLSEISSPVPFFPKAFVGSNIYKVKEIPKIDYLIITHDHWDHMDYETIRKLNFKKVICPIGVGSHFRYWRFDNVIEMDWNEEINFGGFHIYCLPSKHFSGRGLLRNKTLWASFLLKTPDNFTIFIGGDGGYDSRFLKFSKLFGNIDLAILENGQYNKNWPDIHMFPEETIQAAMDLNAKFLFPVHNSKFILSTHDWNEPLEKITQLSKHKNFKLITPIIGEKVELDNLSGQIFQNWWLEDS